MKNKKPNAELIWKQLEDLLVPRLRLPPVDHAIYSYLLRHSRLEGKLRLPFSIPWLARGARVCPGTARAAVRRLVAKGALRLIERTRAGHVVEVRLPEEIRAARPDQTGACNGARSSSAPDLEKIDFLQSPAFRQAIHAREGGACFYCLKRLNRRNRCLDHVVPRVLSGRNSCRNLVSCCADCNSQKSGDSAADFLRKLYRGGHLTFAEFNGRMRALEALAAGKLRPVLPTACQRNGEGTKTLASGNPFPRKFRPPFYPENLGSFSRPRMRQ
jgi:5-methylcytosine-specific restriction endonuclease McrA